MSLPTENLVLVVQFALEAEEAAVHNGSRLSLVSGFSLASQHFRQIVLREIFRTFSISSLSDLERMNNFPDMFRWIRVLHSPVCIAAHLTKAQFARFTWLREVHLWGPSLGLTSVLGRMPDNIREMSLPFEHEHDHFEVLTAASRFHACTRIRVARSHFEFVPAPDAPTGDVPPHHFEYSNIAAKLLKPMRSLRIIEIDHYLTDTDCLEFHNSQCPWTSTSSVFCQTCYAKFGQQTANAEVTCTKIMAESLSGLEVVAWKSWFTPNGEGYSRIFITREVGFDGQKEICVSRERDSIEAEWRLDTSKPLPPRKQ